MRIYDPRVGRFLSVDPITKDYPELTPYQFASNTPVWAMDLDGLEADPFQMHHSRRLIDERRATMTPEQLEQDKALEKKIALGAAATPILIGGAVIAGPTTAVLATTTAVKVGRFVVPPLVWVARNPQVLNEAGSFVMGLLNPGPEDLNPGSNSDELGRMIGNPLRRAFSKVFDADGFAKVTDGLGNEAGRGWLSQGELNLVIKTKGTSLEGHGAQVFDEIFDFVSKNYDEITSIRGTWRAGSMGDNLATFNKLVKEVGMEQAALQTYTGKMASRAGFNKVTVTGVKNSDGDYISVDAIFKKE